MPFFRPTRSTEDTTGLLRCHRDTWQANATTSAAKSTTIPAASTRIIAKRHRAHVAHLRLDAVLNGGCRRVGHNRFHRLEAGSTAEADQYIAGCIILAAAPCTAMVFVWSYLTDADPACTLVQVSVNDLIMLALFVPRLAPALSGKPSTDEDRCGRFGACPQFPIRGPLFAMA